MKGKAVMKSISWRIIASIITFTLLMITTRRLDLSLAGSGAEVLIKLGTYYAHEKVWGD